LAKRVLTISNWPSKIAKSSFVFTKIEMFNRFKRPLLLKPNLNLDPSRSVILFAREGIRHSHSFNSFCIVEQLDKIFDLEEGSTNPRIPCRFLCNTQAGDLDVGNQQKGDWRDFGKKKLWARCHELEGKQKGEEDYPEILEILGVLLSLEEDWKIYEKDDPCFPF